MKTFPLLRQFIVLGTLTLMAQPAPAGVVEAWVQRRGDVVSNAVDEARKVVRDAQGDVIVVGYTDGKRTGRDMLTIKYSGTNGAVLWQKLYNGPENKDDEAQAVAVDSSGNVVVTGYSSAFFRTYDYYTAKYAAADGALLWERRYTGHGDSFANAVAVDANGNVIVTGSSGTGGAADYYTAKYAAADGALLWEKRYNGPDNGQDYGRAVAVDGSGNVVVTGNSVSGIISYDFYTAKYAAADGALIWEKRYNGPANAYDEGRAVALDGDGNVIITGLSTGSSFDYYTAKYAASDGALVWEKRYNGTGNFNDIANAVAVTSNGNVVVTGNSSGTVGGNDYYTAMYAAANGALVWERRYNGPASRDDYATALAVDNNGNVIVTGFSGSAASSDDYYTAKYASTNGALLWEKHYNGSANNNDHAQAVAVDASGDVVVTGPSSNGNNNDLYTAKYAAADGALTWEQRYNGLGNTSDQALAVAVDGSGNVVVTGYSWNGTNNDYSTVKYARTNGAILWEKTYNGPANSGDHARAVAVDSSGNAIVTGESWNGTNYDYYTARYAAADGALLWEKRYNAPPNQDEFPTAITVDTAGNVFITGYSWNGTNHDYSTVKYAMADGALLWERRYNGPANGHDLPVGIAVDSSGNVVVTGGSGNPSNSDYYTAKYAAEDGAVLWEKRYDGPANRSDSASAVAVDGDGNVAVTGGSDNEHSLDYYTAKYAAADGALLWEKRYNGLGDNTDYGRAIAFDSTGNAVVTGYSWNGNPQNYFSYYTAKYAAADGALLWEKRSSPPSNSDDEARAIAVDGSGNVVVTGISRTDFPPNYADYYTVKYAALDGAVVWESRYNGPVISGDHITGQRSLAIGPEGTVVITGSFDGDFGPNTSYDYLTIAYRESPIINCPLNIVTNAITTNGLVVGFTVTATDDSGVAPVMVCVPPSGSQFPVGETLVTCTATDGELLSSTCSFTVRVMVARDAKENVLAELRVLRAATANRYDRRQLDKAIRQLNRSLAARFWVDETHLNEPHGKSVFDRDKLTVGKLCNLIKRRKSDIPEEILQGFVNRIFEADRLLAVVAIQDAITAGGASKRIEQAQKLLAKGDAQERDSRCSNGMENFRNAWKHATH